MRPWFHWADKTRTVIDTQNFIGYSLNQFSQGKGFQAGIWKDNNLCGVIGHGQPIEIHNNVTHIGYWLSEKLQGQGIMTQCVRIVTQHAFAEMGIHRVEIRCQENNMKSRAIPERLGFEKEAVLRLAQHVNGHYQNVVLYAMTADALSEKGTSHV